MHPIRSPKQSDGYYDLSPQERELITNMLIRGFDEYELKMLAGELGAKYDVYRSETPPRTIADKLIDFCEEQGTLGTLVELINSYHPDSGLQYLSERLPRSLNILAQVDIIIESKITSEEIISKIKNYLQYTFDIQSTNVMAMTGGDGTRVLISIVFKGNPNDLLKHIQSALEHDFSNTLISVKKFDSLSLDDQESWRNVLANYPLVTKKGHLVPTTTWTRASQIARNSAYVLLSDLPRRALADVVSQRKHLLQKYAADVLRTPWLCERELYKICGKQYSREITLLSTAINEGIPLKLASISNNVSVDDAIDQLTKDLVYRKAIVRNAARWTVESWALALGLKPPTGSSTTTQVPSTPSSPAPPTPITPSKSSMTTQVKLSTPGVYYSTWQSDVLGRDQTVSDAPWTTLGTTPGTVTLPAGFDFGLRLHRIEGDALQTWVQYLKDIDAKRIQHLDLEDESVDDHGIYALVDSSKLVILTELMVSSKRITDHALSHIANMKLLTVLILNGCIQLTTAGIDHLNGLMRLRELGLAKTQIDDISLPKISKFSNLIEIDLSGTKISDKGMLHLWNMKNLQSINLSSTSITYQGLHALMKLPSLESLALADTEVGNCALEILGDLTTLKRLDVSYTDVSDPGLAHLQSLTSLEVIDLSGTQVTLTGLAHLRQVPSLKKLYLSAEDFADLDLQELQHITGIRDLDLVRHWKIHASNVTKPPTILGTP